MAIKIAGTTVVDDSRNITNIVGANLGAVGNLTVTGGTAGQILSTDGAGGMSFSSNAPTSTTAGTVTTAAQPNITSVGTLTGLNVNGQLDIKEISETIVALGNTGTAKTVDLTQGTVFSATLTGNCTFTLANPNAACSFTLVLTNDASSGRSVAWSGGSFRFPGGASSLSRSTGANDVDVWVFFTVNGGTTWYGNITMIDMVA